MINSRKVQLVIVLLLGCIYAPLLGADPNDAQTELNFEIRQGLPQLRHLRPRSEPQSIYNHYAVLFVRGKWRTYQINVPIEAILETSAGQSMSQRQREVISNEVIRFKDYGTTISDYSYFQVYGVSVDDVKKMVKAFVESIENRINRNKQSKITLMNEYRVKITEIQKQLAEKQDLYRKAAKGFENVKNNTHYLSHEEAMKAVEKLNTTIDELNIETAGMKIKLKAIDREHIAAKETMKSFEQQEIYQNTIWPKLEVMRIDQIIDLRVAEEKMKTASMIRREAEQFYKLYEQKIETNGILQGLNNKLSSYKNSMNDIERYLSTDPGLLPIKVFQSKVTIYPIK